MEISKTHNNESGFTLVELAIVMIIIGLLIGGILKGQELINNSRVTATVAQIKGIDGAISTFRDKYSALPGDMANPAGRLPGCNAVPCNVTGNGDSVILANAAGANFGSAVPVATGVNGEGVRAFSHLAAGDMISGVNPTAAGAVTAGVHLPEAKVGGVFFLGHRASGLQAHTAAATNAPRSGHYIAINGSVAAVAAATGRLTPQQASAIDRKIDDGDPNTGAVRANTAATCITAGVYAENNEGGNCALYARVQG